MYLTETAGRQSAPLMGSVGSSINQPAPKSPAGHQAACSLTIEIIGDAIAAFKKRPDAPTPTGDVAVDIQNLVQFLSAYADHTDTKDRIRIARDVGKVLGAR